MYVATSQKYLEILHAQAPSVPGANFLLEPVRRDVAAAVALAFFSIQKDGWRGPVFFQWTDSYVRKSAAMLASIEAGRALIEADPGKLVIIGEKPRFVNENLGWIGLGEELGRVQGVPYYSLQSTQYRPSKEICEKMFSSGRYVWNTGYFVTSVEFMTSAIRELVPQLAERVEMIVSCRGTPLLQDRLDEIYPEVPMLNFDEAILERLAPHQTVLLNADLEWSDPGSLYALKEFLQESEESTVCRGNVVAVNTRDCLIQNDESGRLVAAMGLDGIVVINTSDVTLVIHKDSVRHLGKLLNRLEIEDWGRLL
jgi:mannose-1-phosphate guanylyltransferase